jgi:hypothetical protein
MVNFFAKPSEIAFHAISKLVAELYHMAQKISITQG